MTNSEGPDKPAQIRRLIMAFTIRINSNARSNATWFVVERMLQQFYKIVFQVSNFSKIESLFSN